MVGNASCLHSRTFLLILTPSWTAIRFPLSTLILQTFMPHSVRLLSGKRGQASFVFECIGSYDDASKLSRNDGDTAGRHFQLRFLNITMNDSSRAEDRQGKVLTPNGFSSVHELHKPRFWPEFRSFYQ
jgi:hypothetical protein